MSVKISTDSWHQLATQFDVFFIDLWGVLIDGKQCFPYADVKLKNKLEKI